MMATTNAIGIVTKSDLYSQLRARLNDVSDKLSALRTRERAEQHAAWAARGGCKRCGGRGWIVAWDTLDSLSGCYAEYGACPDAKVGCSAERAGADPGYYDSKYDRLRGHVDTFVPSAELRELERAFKKLGTWEREVLDEASIARGKIAVVVRGRKVPQGTVGEVIWYGRNTYGYRVGLKDAAGTVHWTSVDNVEVV